MIGFDEGPIGFDERAKAVITRNSG